MKPLDNKDLERFAWEKMAPRIEEKIEKKRRSVFIFRIFGVGLLFLTIGTSIWMTADSGMVTSEKELSEHSAESPIQSNKSSFSENLEDMSIESADLLSQVDEDLTNAEKNSTKTGKVEQSQKGDLAKRDNKSDLTILNKINKDVALKVSRIDNLSEGFTKLDHTISDSNGSYYRTTKDSKKSNINNNSIGGQSGSVISTQNIINKEVKLSQVSQVGESNASSDRVSSTVRASKTQTDFVLEVFDKNEIAIIDSDPIVQLEIKKLETKAISKSSFAPIVHINSKNGRLKNAVEFSFNSNILRKHPHTPQIGTGYTLGYWAYITKEQYAGFEYNFQEVRYQFVYPPEFGGPNVQKVSNNKHRLYNIPIFYGYQFQKLRTQLSIETGVNLTILRISEGDINSVTNSSAIFKIENENYFRQEVGASFLLRAKVDYALGLNYGLFARVGTNMSVTNWYKNDSYQIKPILLSFDLGIRRSF